MAEGLSETPQIVRAGEERALPSSVTVRTERRRPLPHSHKFLAVTATLIGVAIGAIIIAISVLLAPGAPGPGPKWSPWKPPDGGIAGEREIADEVAPFYRADPATQLVVVTVQNINSTSTGGTQIALRDPSTGSLAAVSGNSAVYNLCGLGPNCTISAGTPSSARLLLLRREALELSLYTFKYISGVDNVVAILPPGHTTTTATLTQKPPAPGKTAQSSTIDLAVVFQKQSLQRFLSQPLRQTLPEQLPPTVDEMPIAPEAELVSVITGQALFQQQLLQTQDGSSVLVLDPLPPQ
jgi:hypothetical protein